MIITNLCNASRVEALHPAFKTVFQYINSHDLLNEECGKITLDGDSIFINNVEVQGVKKEDQVLEMHRVYIDIHVVLEGVETIGWKSLEAVENITKEYSSEDDCSLSDDKPVSYTQFKAGDIAIVYPEDLHAPCIGDGKIRKLVAKIML